MYLNLGLKQTHKLQALPEQGVFLMFGRVTGGEASKLKMNHSGSF